MNLAIWIQTENGGGVELLNSAVNILQRLYGTINVVGAICPPGLSLNGAKTLDRQDLKSVDCDLILVAGRKASLQPVLKEVAALGIDTEKVVLDRTVCVPFFTLEKYRKLRRSNLSILSMNCFAGMLYHRFGLPFLTPTINMFTSDTDFLKFINEPEKNVMAELNLTGTAFNPTLKIEYPIFKIGGSEWKFNHYADADAAVKKWHERAARINWENFLAVMYTDNPDVLAEFDKLPFAKKVCFVSFKTDLNSGFYINARGSELWRFVNAVATGKLATWDIWDMLLYGKKTLIK